MLGARRAGRDHALRAGSIAVAAAAAPAPMNALRVNSAIRWVLGDARERAGEVLEVLVRAGGGVGVLPAARRVLDDVPRGDERLERLLLVLAEYPAGGV